MADGHADLLVWRHTANTDEYRLVAQSAEGVIPPDAAPPIPTSIPVLPGDTISIFSIDNVAPSHNDGTLDDKTMGAGPVGLGETLGPTGASDHMGNVTAGWRANASATLTAPDPLVPAAAVTATPPRAKKCKKKKRKRAAAAKRCKKRKK
jgi:hypothetical protein